MKRLDYILMLTVSLLLTGCQSGQPQLSTYPGYSLVFADEFDGDAINPANWTHEVGDQWHNEEQQAYTDRAKNSYVKDGNLVIVAQKESYHGKSFTSARIISKHKQDFRYGRIEASIKLPRGDGMWPAFWMMPSDDVYGTWAASGEIDILEAKNTPLEIRGNLHFGGMHPDNAKTGSSAYSDGSDFSQDYHLYAIEWDPKEIRWYCDNNLYKTTDIWWTGSKEDNGTFPAPFDQRFYILLNVAVGGAYVDCLVPECVTADFPQKMYVDYVRVYQKAD
jgi:beta-glucanase (GH16 family)